MNKPSNPDQTLKTKRTFRMIWVVNGSLIVILVFCSYWFYKQVWGKPDPMAQAMQSQNNLDTLSESPPDTPEPIITNSVEISTLEKPAAVELSLSPSITHTSIPSIPTVQETSTGFSTLITTLTPFPTSTSTLGSALQQPSIKGVSTIIGYSVENRPLEIYQFGDGPIERLIIAGIHGGSEWNTILLAQELLTTLNSHPELIPPGMRLYILPALNPDGEARSHKYEGRANSHGVDLNRNWDAGWQESWDSSGCWAFLPISGGAYPVSEPETTALQNFILAHSIDAIISYHSANLGIFAGGIPLTPNSINLAKTIAEASPYHYPPTESGCQYTGQFIDWASLQGIAAVDVELSNHTDTDFEINLKILAAFLNWQLPKH